MDWKGHFETQSFKEGDLIFAPGGICRHLYFINQGVIRIMSVSDKGDDITHYFLKENYFCTILGSFLEQTPALEGIQAATDVEVLVIGKDDFNQLVKEDAEFKKAFELHPMACCKRSGLRICCMAMMPLPVTACSSKNYLISPPVYN